MVPTPTDTPVVPAKKAGNDPKAPDERDAEGSEPAVAAAPRAPWIVHALGLTLAGVFVWLLAPGDTAPPTPVAQTAAAPVETPSAAPEAKEGKTRRTRARQRGSAPAPSDSVSGWSDPGRAPVAIDSGFRRPLDGTGADSELRSMYLSSVLRVGDENILGGLQFNRSTYAPILKAGTAVFDFGVAMHPPTTGQASATFKIPEGARNFQATLVLANGGSPSASLCETQGGSVTFLVKTDDNEAYKKIVVGPDGPHAQVQVELTAAMKTLTLITDSADGDQTCDGAAWGIARFMVEPPKTLRVEKSATASGTK